MFFFSAEENQSCKFIPLFHNSLNKKEIGKKTTRYRTLCERYSLWI